MRDGYRARYQPVRPGGRECPALCTLGLRKLNTDYIDFGFIHCLDQPEEFDKAESRGIIRMVQRFKEDCKARHIGFSTHNPAMANRMLDEKRSVFPFALMPYQCIQYALDKPGVLSVLAGTEIKEYFGL